MKSATIIEPHRIRDERERPVRQLACFICGENPCRSQSLCRACHNTDARKARSEKPHYVDASLWREPPHDVSALLDRSVLLGRAWAVLNRRRVDAPRATVEALLYELRTHGLDAFESPNCRRRVVEFSADQLSEVMAALIRVRAGCAAVTDELLIALDRIRRQ
jgi:hypothetical protein